MENQTIVNIGLGTLLALILTFQIVGDINLSPTHYCEDKQIKAFCYGISSTNKTCYTQINNGGAKLCSSLWKIIPIDNYINNHKLVKYSCNNINCTRIE